MNCGQKEENLKVKFKLNSPTKPNLIIVVSMIKFSIVGHLLYSQFEF